MTNLFDGQITDLLNNSMKYNPETIAMGYAVLQEKRRIMEYVDRTRLKALVDTLDESVLNYLAVELRTPSYHDTFSIDVKRKLIAGTLPFYSKLGTPSAVDWVIRTIFGAGGMEEWNEYGGEPHHFRAVIGVEGNPITPENRAEFIRIVTQVKRLSSWLDGLVTETPIGPEFLRITPVLGPCMSITQLPELEAEPLPPARIGVAGVLCLTIAETILPELEEVV